MKFWSLTLDGYISLLFPPSTFFIPFPLCPFPCFNLIGKPVTRCQADKCTGGLLTFNLFLDRCKYCCQWYWSRVQQSFKEPAHPFSKPGLITISHWKLWSRIFVLDENNRIKPAQLQKIAFIFKQCYTHTDTLLMILLPWRKYIAPARNLSFGALSHTSDDKIPAERLLFNLIGHRLYSGQSSLLSSFSLDQEENSF